MPQIFRFGSYTLFFWSNEGIPLEPVHVHVAVKSPSRNSTEIWITRDLKTVIANNDSDIPPNDLSNIRTLIEMRVFEIIEKWKDHFKTSEVKFYC